MSRNALVSELINLFFVIRYVTRILKVDKKNSKSNVFSIDGIFSIMRYYLRIAWKNGVV